MVGPIQANNQIPASIRLRRPVFLFLFLFSFLLFAVLSLICSPMPMPSLTITAHAKINLALALGQPESARTSHAGFHPICTWIHAIGLCDTLHIERLKAGAHSSWQICWQADAPRKSTLDWPAQQDLAWRALGLLEAHAGRSLPTRIVIDKAIPTGSGLGGGSADAAATLVAVNRVWELGLDVQTLSEIGFGLGSDVPFFLDENDRSARFDATGCSLAPRPAIVEGFGQQLTRCARIPRPVLVLVPRFGCNTGEVYRAFDQEQSTPTPTPTTTTTPDDSLQPCTLGTAVPRSGLVHAMAQASEVVSDRLFNDLSQAACRVKPELGELMGRARALLGCPIHMSGSGSTLFAFPAAKGKGVSAVAQAVARDLPEVVPIQTQLLSP